MSREGYVYILGTRGIYYKIGRSSKLDRRIKQLKIQLPFPVKVLYAVKVRDCAYTEAKLHDLYFERRLNGEWFELDAESVEWVKYLSEYRGFVEDESGLLVPATPLVPCPFSRPVSQLRSREMFL